MERVTENLLRQQMELQSQQQKFLEQILNQMSGQRVEQPEPRVLNVGLLNEFIDERVENDGATRGTTLVARSGTSVIGT